ncbi:MAG: flagellar basal body L-ring protein FlgH [Pseudopelagicola sp.]|nr:flagellar basal body L-ring protein FlgH [Pseudopelagicola sp.]
MRFLICLGVLTSVTACARMDHIGQPPEFSPVENSAEHYVMMNPPMPQTVHLKHPVKASSLWTGDQESLLGDRRAMKQGDIVTVVLEIDEEAEISNQTSRSRNGSESLNVPNLFGVPQRIDEKLPDGATMSEAVSIGSSSQSGGDGSVSRSEKLMLRVAATVVDVLPNGVLSIKGSQELRVNYEMRELLVSGYVRPQDISRQNEITYDKIASARVSYGGRGHISDVQQPRYGLQILDAILPF